MARAFQNYFLLLLALLVMSIADIGNIKWTIAKKQGCSTFEGSWVLDQSYPLYNSSACPFIRWENDCIARPDREYLKYRWQPAQCDIPRFDGRNLLRRFKGKKIMFVGDSISLNQWQSFTCLLHAAVPNSNFTQERINSTRTIHFQHYGVSVSYFNTPYLVDVENVVQQNGTVLRVLKLHSLKNGETWKQADILIFNTWLWWGWWQGVAKQQWDRIQKIEGGEIVEDMDHMDAFRKGLTTWAKWVDSDVDPIKTKVFYRGVTTMHYNGAEWNAPGVTNCSLEKVPVNGSTYPAGLPLEAKVTDDILSKIRKPVFLLNITTLSQLRKDGHPSVYKDSSQMDCTHWCIAGVPDTWNELLYAALT